MRNKKEGIQAKDITESDIYVGLTNSGYGSIWFQTYKILAIKKASNSRSAYYFKISGLYLKRQDKIEVIDYNKQMTEIYAEMYTHDYESIRLASEIELRIYNQYKENSIFL